MFTKTEQIDLSRVIIESGGTVVEQSPLTIQRTEDELRMRFPQDDTGYKWCDEDYLVIDLKGEQDSKVNLLLEFYHGTEKAECNYKMIPGCRVKMAFPLAELASKRFFLTTQPGSLKCSFQGNPVTIDEIDSVILRVMKGRNEKSFTLYNIYLSKKLPDFTVYGQPLVDRFGQWNAMDWPHKIKNEAELTDFLHKEYEYALTHWCYPSEEFDEYGGWNQLHFEPRGHFYVHHDGNRWWLVDPLGNAFFSSGVCYATRMGVHGFVSGVETLFEELPDPQDPLLGKAWTTADAIPEFVKRNGLEAGKKRKMVNFARANMMRAFGERWWDAWLTINTARMKRWGFNTLSVCVNNYFDERVEDYVAKAKIPFTWTLKNFPKTKNMIFRDFPDVFSAEYQQLSREFAKQLKSFVGNPYFIGYFINNEPEWLSQRSVNPAERLLQTLNACESKQVLIQWLEQRYGNVQNFNRSWNLQVVDYQELTNKIIKEFNEVAHQDMMEFRQILIAKYIQVPTDELKAVCPTALNLGMRYAQVTENDFAGDTLFDLFSTNNYSKEPRLLHELVHRCTKKPLIIGEWHYGGSDQGLLSNALVNATTQTERGKACANYLKMAMADPQYLGVHYFEWNDQPLLGRFDGECAQHGLIDVCNQPYEECVRQMAEVNKYMYEYCSGRKEVVLEPWEIAEKY